MKVARSKILVLEEMLSSLKDIKKTKFAYAVAKNMQKVESECKAIRKALEPLARIKELEESRQRLCTELAKKDPSGAPIIMNGVYVFEDQEEAIKKLNDLKSGYVDDLQKQKIKSTVEDEAFLGEEVDFDAHRMEIDELGDDISAAVMKSFLDCGIIVE